MVFIKVVFWICVFVIFWANIGYPISIILLDKILKKKIVKNKQESGNKALGFELV